MLGVCPVPTQGGEQPLVVAHNVQLRVKRDAQPVLEFGYCGQRGPNTPLMLALNVLVVGENDRFLRIEVVVGGAERKASLRRDFAHAGLIKPVFPEELEGSLEDAGPGLLAFGRGFEHVQILPWRAAVSRHLLN
jgi:hypothetical protein